MRALERLRLIFGTLAVVGMLALASPGVQVARAGSGDVADAAPQCRANDVARTDAQLEAYLLALREAQREAAAGDGPEIVVLNNRGYNYAPPASTPEVPAPTR